ncbi:MAG: tryptophan synthase subunit alpha [Armatimonadetes bacterium]|nr:tryptophan synthase subunit alpha [Armatimonadota bacterium]
MSPLSERFAQLRAQGERALLAFVTAGDPSLDDLPEILEILETGGADVIEVGIPFSDPIADGPTIQASSQRALERGTRMSGVFDSVAQASVSTPIVYMGYTNMALRIGFDQFARRAKDSGASGVILSDLTPEEAGEWKAVASNAGLDTIFLVAPTSTEARIRAACGASTGFVYCVSRTGVTGAGREVPREVAESVQRIRKCSDLPVCVGFGISKPEHVRMVCEVADGAVVGSYLVDLLHQVWTAPDGPDRVCEAIRTLKSGAAAH